MPPAVCALRSGHVVELVEPVEPVSIPSAPNAGAGPICPLCRRDGRLVRLEFHTQSAMWWHSEAGARGRRCQVSCFVELPPQPEPGA